MHLQPAAIRLLRLRIDLWASNNGVNNKWLKEFANETKVRCCNDGAPHCLPSLFALTFEALTPASWARAFYRASHVKM